MKHYRIIQNRKGYYVQQKWLGIWWWVGDGPFYSPETAEGHMNWLAFKTRVIAQYKL